MTMTPGPETTPVPAAATPAPYVPVAKPPRNKLGVAALIVVLFALVVPGILAIVATILSVTEGAQTPDTVGWGVLGGVVFAGLGFGLAGPIALIGDVLAIIALTRKNRGKVAAIIALVIGAPLGIIGLFVLPLAFSVLFS